MTRFANLTDKRMKFSATVSEFGTKPGWTGFPVDTILLTDIVAETGDKAEHVWFTLTQGFYGLKIGDRIEFAARVKEYEKGYVNYRRGIDERRIDNKLSHPTKIRVVTEVSQ